MNTTRNLLAFPLALVALASTAHAQQPYADWEFRMPLTLAGYEAPDALTNFPLLVVLGEHVPGFRYADFRSPAGGDLRFSDSLETAELPFEIESWNTGGVSHVWVQVPEIAGAGTVIHAYWGSDNTTLPAANPWDNNFVGVWHLAQSNALDSTANAFHGTAVGTVAETADGQINGAVDTTTSSHIAVPDHDAFTLGADYTVSAWIKSDAIGNLHEGFLGTYNTAGFIFALENTAGNTLRFWAGNTWRSSGVNIPDNEWKLVAYSVSGTDGRFYVDGVQVASAAGLAINNGGELQLGAAGTSWSTYRYDGLLDEVRISAAARGSNWMWASWISQASNDTFIAYGTADFQSPELAVKAYAPSSITSTSAVFEARLGGIGDAENPTVHFYWGAADGGTNNPLTWDHAATLGNAWGKGDYISFFRDGLLSGSTYVYRAYVTNLTGEAWSEPQTFTNLYLAAVTNLGAFGIRRDNARLAGEVTGLGEDAAPDITLLLWPDGSTETSAIPLGVQAGAFIADVTNLAPDTLYGFQFAASNSVGAAFSHADAFTTLAEDPVSWYVSTNGANAGGTNWAGAFTSLHTAWENVRANDTVYLAGHFFPVETQLVWWLPGISLLGGYEGLTGEPGTNDPTAWPTVLQRTGSINYRILNLTNVTNATIRGVTIRNGLLAGTIYGGGIYLSGSTNITIESCTIESNRLTHTTINQYPAGAGLYAVNSHLLITNSLFRWNQTFGGVVNYNGSGHGAGLFISGGRMDLADCLIVSNSALHIGNQRSSGAGLFLNGGIHQVFRSRFENNTGNGHGGGVYMTGANVALLDSVVIRANSASLGSGGLYMNGGTVRNALIVENSTPANSGGAYVALASSQLQNVTLVRNTSAAVGSIAGLNLTAGAATNCIVYHNIRTVDSAIANITESAGTVANSCTWPLRAGDGNTEADPEFFDTANGDYRLRPGSPAINSAVELPWMTDYTDVSGGLPRIIAGAPDMGAHEAQAADQGDFRVNFIADVTQGHDALTVEFTAHVAGTDTFGLVYRWDFDNDGYFDVEGPDKMVVSRVFPSGKHDVRLKVENHVPEYTEVTKTAYIFVSPSTLYVWSGGDHSTGTNWASAFTNIQDALDQCIGSNTILLAGETFNLTGSLIWAGLDDIHILGGYEASNSPAGPGPWDSAQWPTVIRRGVSANFRVIDAAYLTDCSLSRVTVDNGNTPADATLAQGGGLRLTSSSMTIADCVFTNNRVNASGNGYAWGGGIHAQNSTLTVLRTLFIRNRAVGTPTTNNNRSHGGGLSANSGSVTLENCRFLYNDADAIGHHGNQGGALHLAGAGPHAVRNSLFAFNRAGFTASSAGGTSLGGAIYMAGGTVVESCTAASNQVGSANGNTASTGGGIYAASGFATNTIAFHNWNRRNSVVSDVYAANLGRFAYSCAAELTNAVDANITADPLFTDIDGGDFTLLVVSPCRNAGLNLPWMADADDLAGNPRIRSGVVDMGAYEIAPPSGTVIIIR